MTNLTTTGDPTFAEWMALRRVHDGGVTTRDGTYLQHGRPIVGEVAATLDRLIRAECLALGRPDPDGQRTVCVTVTGQTRYAQLRQVFHG